MTDNIGRALLKAAAAASDACAHGIDAWLQLYDGDTRVDPAISAQMEDIERLIIKIQSALHGRIGEDPHYLS